MSLLVGALAAAAGGGALLVGLDRFAIETLKPPPRAPTGHPSRLGLPHGYEDAEIVSSGLRLSGWLLAPDPAFPHKAAVAVVHGWGAHGGDMLPLAAPLAARGHPVLVFDARHHGRSPAARHLTVAQFGHDVDAAARWLADRYPARPRVLVGHSLGGAAAVLAATEGAPVHGVAHLAAPADLLEVLAIHYGRRRLPGALVVRLLVPFWERHAGTRFSRLQPFLRAPELEVPLLVVGAERDRHVPVEHVLRMAAVPGVELLVVPDAGHFDVLTRPELHLALERLLEAVERKAAEVRASPAEASIAAPPD